MIRAVCFLGLSLVLANTGPAADWPQWRGPNRDGISAETGWSDQWPDDGPRQLWKAAVGTGFSSLAVSQGRAFTIGNQNDTDTVYCFDASTGNVLWKHAYPCLLGSKYYEGGPGSTPTVDGDRVYTLGKEGQLFCLQAATGKVVWSKDLQQDFGGQRPTWGYAGSPVVLGDAVLLDVGGPGASVVAFQKLTGAVIWKDGDDPASYGTIAPFRHQQRVCLASFNAFGLVVREATTGREIARYKWETKHDVNAVTPIIDGDRFFISSGYGAGCALVQLTPDGFKELWRNKNMRNHFNNCVLWKGHLYGFDEGTLACLEFATGEVKWTENSLGKASLMIADGKLIIQAERGDLVVAEATPAAYKEIARAGVLSGRCWTQPVLANGRIYCRNAAGEVVCLAVGKP